jgi:hypothetical protein
MDFVNAILNEDELKDFNEDELKRFINILNTVKSFLSINSESKLESIKNNEEFIKNLDFIKYLLCVDRDNSIITRFDNGSKYFNAKTIYNRYAETHTNDKIKYPILTDVQSSCDASNKMLYDKIISYLRNQSGEIKVDTLISTINKKIQQKESLEQSTPMNVQPSSDNNNNNNDNNNNDNDNNNDDILTNNPLAINKIPEDIKPPPSLSYDDLLYSIKKNLT